MRDLILHIGMNKTGSTSLQATLAKTRSGSDWSFAVPVIPNASNVVRLAVHPKGAAEEWRLQDGARTPEEAVASIKRALAAVETPRGVMSGEGMFRLGEVPIRVLVDLARPYAERIGAVAYIRSPAAFMVATYQQRMKMRYVALDDIHRPPMLKFDRSAAVWEAVLGAENVALRPYDRTRLRDGSVVTDFADVCGLGGLGPTANDHNAGLSGEAMRLLVQYRRRVPTRRKGDEIVITELRELAGPRFAVAPALRAPAHAAAERMRDWALDRMDWDLSEPPDDPDARPIATEADFDDLTPETIEWLAERTQRKASELTRDMDAVAAAVAALADPQRPTSASKPTLWKRAVQQVRRRVAHK